VQCTPPHSAIAPPAHLPAGCLAGQGGENPAQADHGSAITAGVPPYPRRNLAARLRDYRWPGAGERQSRAAAPHVAWAGRGGRGPLARTAGGAVPGGGGRRLTARNLQPYAYLNRRGERALSAPAKTRQPSRGKRCGILGRLSAAVADRPDGWRGRAVRPPGGTGPEPPALPSRGRRPACWAGELARSRD